MGGWKVARKRRRIQDLITVDMVVDGDETTGWVHTHGMHELGLPELEIRNVSPPFLMVEAGRLLNHVAQYMLDSAKPVRLGDTLQFGKHPAESLRFVKLPEIPGEELHHQSERWTLVADPGSCSCDACRANGLH